MFLERESDDCNDWDTRRLCNHNPVDFDWQLIVYGGAMHGFTHEAGPHLPGVAYHAQSDARSAAAMQGFFVELFD